VATEIILVHFICPNLSLKTEYTMFSAGVTPTYSSSYELHFVWTVISWLAVNTQQSICSHKWGLSLSSNCDIRRAGHCWLPHVQFCDVTYEHCYAFNHGETENKREHISR